MLGLAKTKDIDALIRDEASKYLYEVLSAEVSQLASLDRWTQQRIIDENLAKIALVLEADDPLENCYQNLVREIDTEAEVGIYLAGRGADLPELRELSGDPGISCRLAANMTTIAPIVFEDEFAQSDVGMKTVWATIQARFDRAMIDATVSAIVMSNLVEDDYQTADMLHSLRSLLYAFHEDLVRRLCKLPSMLNEHGTRELVLMVSEFAARAGDYGSRVEAIEKRAGTM